MNKEQKKRLEDAGWKFGTVQEFLLDLSDVDTKLNDIQLILTKLSEKKDEQATM